MEIYLDTNIIWAWFRNFMTSLKDNKPLEMPSILEFVMSRKELQKFTTILTQIEIFRYLKAEWNADEENCNIAWNSFVKSFAVLEIKARHIELYELLFLVSKVATKKKTLVNLMHLQLAKKNSLWFLTGEENLKTKYKEYYDNVITYEELRQISP